MNDCSEKILAGERITREKAETLVSMPLAQLGSLAHRCRERITRDAYGGRGSEIVTYIVDRNINYTNICTTQCRFCAFHRGLDEGYVLTPETLDAKMDELAAEGGAQVLLQGGHHPTLGLDFYVGILERMRARHPQINIHGFSPPEIWHFAKLFNMSPRDVLARLREAGLGSMPGGGAEILVDAVRAQIAPRKCTSDQWLEVMRLVHEAGMTSSATMMFGHVETWHDRIEHLDRLRTLQDETRGFTAFICWPFQPRNTRIDLPAAASPVEYLRMQAVARIYLDNFPNIQASWVTQGPQIGQVALAYGANDFGSVMMEENVVSAAGTAFQVTRMEIERLIREAGYEPRRRTTDYRLLFSCDAD